MLTATTDTLTKLRLVCNLIYETKKLKSQLNSAECELANAINDFGTWSVPKDAKENESFHFWIGDGILEVTKKKDGMADYVIRWRVPISTRVAVEMCLCDSLKLTK